MNIVFYHSFISSRPVKVTMQKPVKFYSALLWCAITSLIIFAMQFKYNFIRPLKFTIYNRIWGDKNTDSYKKLPLKYILVWTVYSQITESFIDWGEGTKLFEHRNCSKTNCYITSTRYYLNDLRKYDALMFTLPDLFNEYSYYNELPNIRSTNQKYIFGTMPSLSGQLFCDDNFDLFFNWTWTYKLDSDEVNGLITIRNKEGSVIGPKQEMNWIKVEDMMPIDNFLKQKISTKKFAAALIAPNCLVPQKNLVYELKLQMEFYDLQLDIYQECQSDSQKFKVKKWLKMLETDYYFYLSFENDIAGDYVTEQLLYPLQHYAVPIVYGGANYSRFMPEGIYLSANNFTAAELAKKMGTIIRNDELYYNYFKWHNYYSYHRADASPETDPYCKLCAMLNDKNRYEIKSVYYNFIDWWNSHKCHGPLK